MTLTEWLLIGTITLLFLIIVHIRVGLRNQVRIAKMILRFGKMIAKD